MSGEGRAGPLRAITLTVCIAAPAAVLPGCERPEAEGGNRTLPVLAHSASPPLTPAGRLSVPAPPDPWPKRVIGSWELRGPMHPALRGPNAVVMCSMTAMTPAGTPRLSFALTRFGSVSGSLENSAWDMVRRVDGTVTVSAGGRDLPVSVIGVGSALLFQARPGPDGAIPLASALAGAGGTVRVTTPSRETLVFEARATRQALQALADCEERTFGSAFVEISIREPRGRNPMQAPR